MFTDNLSFCLHSRESQGLIGFSDMLWLPSEGPDSPAELVIWSLEPSAFLLLPEANQPHAQVMGLEVAPAKHWQSPQGPGPALETPEQCLVSTGV